MEDDDSLESILDNFLKKQISELEIIHGENIPLEALASLISERHTKLQLSENQISKDLDQKEIIIKTNIHSLLGDLENRRVIRTLKSRDNTNYEISHDLLAFVVGKNLTEEMKMRERAEEVYRVFSEKEGYFSQDDIDYLRPFKKFKKYPDELSQRVEQSVTFIENQRKSEFIRIQKQAEKEKELRTKAQRNETRARKRTRLAIMLSLLAIFIAILAGSYYLKAEIAREEAFENEKIAKLKTKEAQANLEKVKKEEEKTSRLLKQVKNEKDATETQRQLAEKSKKLAEQKTKQLEKEKQTVDELLISSQEARELAETQEIIAKTNEKKAKDALAVIDKSNELKSKEFLSSAEEHFQNFELEKATDDCLNAILVNGKSPKTNNLIQELSFIFLESNQLKKCAISLGLNSNEPRNLDFNF